VTQPSWPKGISGNPSGRPRKPITDAYADIAEQKYPDDPKGRTYAQLAAEGQFNAAIKGKTDELERVDLGKMNLQLVANEENQDRAQCGKN
jgi:hypothetical protein